MSLHEIAFFFFIAIAAGGLLMATLIALRKPFPSLLSIGHGLGGLAAVALLFAANLMGRDQTSTTSWWSLGVLVSGLLGGLVLFRVVFRNRPPLPMVALHGSLGAVGIYLLYRAVF